MKKQWILGTLGITVLLLVLIIVGVRGAWADVLAAPAAKPVHARQTGSSTIWQVHAAVAGGSGVFSDSGQILGSSRSQDVALGDLDEDGDLDAFVANYDQPNKVWLNDGMGTFADSGQSLGSSDSFNVVLGDLDGDGDLDAFVANYNYQANKVWLNDGGGIFSDSGQTLGGSGSLGVALGDVDGDGDIDAFVANYNGDANKVWLNDGTGVFSDSGQSLGSSWSYSVALGDVDGDSDLDAFVANHGYPYGLANKVWLNNGMGTFNDSGQSLGSSDSRRLALGDVDSDGDLDAFIGNDGVNKVWLNNGAGIFSDSGQSLGNSNSYGVALGDVDGDGDFDAFVGNWAQANKVWLNDGTGVFSDSGQSLGSSQSFGVALGDVDGDGDLDAFVANYSQANKLWLNGGASIGLILDGPTVDDMGFCWLSYQGLLRAESELGVTGTVYTSTTSADYGPNLQQCVDDGNDLCISVGFSMADATLSAAQGNPGTYFAIVDFAWESYPDNLRGMVFAAAEASYLGGTLAGLMTESDVVGDIGGVQIPPVEEFVEGYRNGAQCANPDVTVLITYTDTFSDPDLGAQVAQDMIAQGADVIFAAAGVTSHGAVLTATQSGVWGIGVDTDFYTTVFMSGTVPGSDKLLSSVMKRVDNAVFDTIADVVSGTFTSGTVLYDLAADGVGLAPFHETDPFVPQSVRDELASVEQGIINDTIDVNDPCVLTVTSTADSGPGTLRQALLDAGNGDTITFDPAVFPPGSPATIFLTSGLPNISQGNLTIDASDAGVILDGSGIGTTPEAVLVDDVSLTLDGGPNPITNGDFSAGLGHWRPWDDDAGATRGLNSSDFTSGPQSYEWSSVAHAGDSRTVYDTTDTSDPFDDWPYYDGSTVWIPATGGNTAELRFWYRYGEVGVVLRALFPDGHEEWLGEWWFDWEPDWMEAIVTQVLPDDAVGVALELRHNHPERWTNGLSISSNGNTIRGLQIVNFPGNGIALYGGAQDNTIGGDRGVGAGPLGQGNLISGNGGFGIGMWDSGTSFNTITGNYIGTDLSGAATLGNRYDGVHMNGPSYNQVIGNLISGNEGSGVSFCCTSDTSYNAVSGNYIGTDVGGTVALPNGSNGVSISGGASYNLIGGPTPDERNLIIANDGFGVRIWDTGTISNTVQGNWIGLDLDGARQAFPTDAAISPDYPNDCTLYVATLSTGVHKSTDCGDTWAEVNNGLTESRLIQVEIPPDASDASTVYALAENGHLFVTTDGGANWSLVSTGLGEIDRRNLVLSADFSNDQTMYASAEHWSWDELGGGPGVFKSTDGGVNWTRMVNGISDDHVWKVIVSPDPAEKETLFALTHSGIEKSTDGGENWSTVPSPDTDLTDLALSPAYASDQTVFVISNNGRVYWSTDGGASWSGVDALRGDPRHLALSPDFANDRTVCHGGGWNDRIYCSTDGGVTWTQVETGLPGGLQDASTGIVFSPDYPADPTGFVISVAGMVRSTDGGATWELVRGLRDLGNERGVSIGGGVSYNTIGPDNVISNNHFGVTIEGDDTSLNVVAGNLIGTDPTGTFAQSNSEDGVTMWGGHHNLIGGDTAEERNVVSGVVWGEAVRLNGSGVLSNTVSGNYIGTDISGTMGIGNVWRGVAIHNGASYNQVGGDTPGERNVISGNSDGVGIWDSDTRYNIISGNYIGTDASGTLPLGNDWDGISLRDAANNVIGGPSYAERNIITYNDGNGISIHGDGAVSNIVQNNWIGFDADGTGGLDPRDLVVANDGTVFLADFGRGVFRSTDAAASWQAVNAGLTTLNIEIVAVSPDFATDQRVWAWGDGQLFASDDAGASWSLLSDVLPGDLNALEASPNYGFDETLLAAVEGHGIYKSTDGGISWEQVYETDNADNIAFSPGFATDQVVLVGKQWYGVLRSTDGGDSWVESNTGLPDISVLDLAFAADGQTVLLVSHHCGNDGVYRSTDAGQTWSGSGDGLGDCGPDWQVAVSPNFASDGIAFAAEDQMFRSTDGGNTWDWSGDGVFGSRAYALALSPDFASDETAYFANFVGVFRTTDAGEHWTWAGANLGDRGNSGRGVEICCGAGANQVLDNVIGRNGSEGISISDSEAAGSLVDGNLVGLAPDGVTRAGNGGTNIRIDTPYVAVTNNTSSAGSHGGLRSGTTAHHLTITGNRFGTDVSGTIGVGNSYDGLSLESSWDTVRNNIIAGNWGVGIWASENVSSSVFAGNLIGVDASGGVALPNEDGFELSGSHNTIGGTTPADRNIISGNDGSGLGISARWTGPSRLPDLTGMTPSYVGIFPEIDFPNTSGLFISRDGIMPTNASGDPFYDMFAARFTGTIHFPVAGDYHFTLGSDDGSLLYIDDDLIIDRNYLTGFGTSEATVSMPAGDLSIEIDFFENQGDAGLLFTADGPGAVTLTAGGSPGLQGEFFELDWVLAGGEHNQVSGNYIGVDVSGMTVLGNGDAGVYIGDGARYNVIGGNNATPGGNCTGECNVISGNGWDGVAIRDSGTMSNTISGNYIGTDVSGTVGLGNGDGDDGVGIRFGPAYNVIGGDTPGERNLLSGNADNGVKIDGAMNNTVIGNYIGTDAGGTVAIGNVEDGVGIQGGASFNRIGGNTADERNLISGNGEAGVSIRDGSTNNTIIGNLIGTDASGTQPLGNGLRSSAKEDALMKSASWLESQQPQPAFSTPRENYPPDLEPGFHATERWPEMQPESTLPLESVSNRSPISNPQARSENGQSQGKAKSSAEVSIEVALASSNAGDGVYIGDGATLNTIGISNTIAFNGGHGVRVEGSDTPNNTITRNSIFHNDGVGIALSDGGNGGLAAPRLTEVDLANGVVNGTACANCTVEIYSADDEEGRIFEGETTADGTGNFAFNKGAPLAGPNVTATATDAAGNTSPFSPLFEILWVDLGLDYTREALDRLGLAYTRVAVGDFAGVDLSDYDVLFVGSTDEPVPDDIFQPLVDRKADIAAFVRAGGGLVALSNGGDWGGDSTSLDWTWVPITITEDTTAVTRRTHIITPTHTLVEGLTDANFFYWWGAHGEPFIAWDWPEATSVVQASQAGRSALLAGPYGAGRMALTGMFPDRDSDGDRFLETLLTWATGQTVDMPPQVARVHPEPNGWAATNTRLRVVFDQLMDPATVTDGMLTVVADSGPVAGALTFLPDISQIFFTPDAPLTPGEMVTATLAATVADLNGNPLDGNGDGTGGDAYTWHFAVRSGDTITVTSTNNEGPGTLRQALEDALPGDTITFDPAVFPPASPATIALDWDLPELTAGYVTVDASNAGVIIDNANGGWAALRVRSDGNVLQGLTIVNSPNTGLWIGNGAAYNLIGGDRTVGSGPNGQGNTIGNNGDWGIMVQHTTPFNTFLGNYVGTDPTGTQAWPNGQNWGASGLFIEQGSDYTVIGSTVPGERNLLSGNEGDGLDINESYYVTVTNNYLGTDASGTVALPNQACGLDLQGGSRYSRFEGNVFSGNWCGVQTDDPGTGYNEFIGNYFGFGVDASGTNVVPNNYGLYVFDHVEGTLVEGNVFANTYYGIVAFGNNNVYRNNYIGTDPTETADWGHQYAGIIVYGYRTEERGEDTYDNLIEDNVIAHNGQGVIIYRWGDARVDGNTLRRNRIYDSSGSAWSGYWLDEGISLFNDANANLAPPIVTSFNITTGDASGTACPTCTVEVFSDNDDEGRWYEGTTTADGAGNWSFSKGSAFTGPNVHATATDADGNTSEFSGPPPIVSSVSPTSTVPGTVNLGVTINGDHFRDNEPLTVDFGDGVSATNVSFYDSTEIKVYLNVDSGAALGLRDVTVTNYDGQSGTLPGGFEIVAVPPPPPTVTAVSPDEVATDVSGNLTIHGVGFIDLPDVVISGDGVTVHWIGFEDSTRLAINVSVDPTATLGPRDVTVTNPDGQSDTLAGALTVVAPIFTDVAPSLGLNMSSGEHGAAWGDLDGDSWLDLAIGNGTLYTSTMGVAFNDATAAAGLDPVGYLGGVAWGDYDNDGDLDLLSSWRKVYRQDSLPFTKVWDQGGDSAPLAWVDYDLDGDLDAYASGRLYRNDGGDTFNDVTDGAGVMVEDELEWLASVWADYDDDSDPDLYITCNNCENRLYRNNGDGTFADVTSAAGVGNTGSGHGAVWGDYDNDGDFDLFIANNNHEYSVLYRNNGDGTFQDVSAAAGLHDRPGFGTGANWLDYNLDGWLDIFVVNRGDENRLYRNNGDGTFTDYRLAAGVADPRDSEGSTVGDYDNDGDPDIYVVSGIWGTGTPNFLFRNNTDPGADGPHWLKVKLEGTLSNRSAIGAVVRVYGAGLTQTRQFAGSTGYMSQDALEAIFGFGDHAGPVTVEVTWPSGIVDTLTGVAIDQVITVVESGEAVTISEVQVSNARDTSFTVSWITGIPSDGRVNYGTDPANLDQTAYDDRGAETSDDTHYVTLEGLLPNTTYYFGVVSGSTTDDNDGAHYSVTTGPTLGLPASDTIYGQVFKEDGTTPAEGTVVYITLRDGDNSGSPGEAALLSALVNGDGWWSTNLGNARTSDLSAYFTYSASGDQVKLEAQGAADGTGCLLVDTADDSSAADLILNVSTCPIEVHMPFKVGWNFISLPVNPTTAYTAESLCDEINEQGGDVVEVDRWHASGWDGHICDLPFNDFDIELGQGYFVKSNSESTWTVEGWLVDAGVPLELQVGWNSMAIHHSNAYTAQGLCDEVNGHCGDGVAVEVDRWHASGWDGHISGLPFNNFDIEIGKGYFVKASDACTMTPDGDGPVGTTMVSLIRDYNNESNMGNLVTDGMRWKADLLDDGRLNGSVDIAFTNPGGLRTDITIPGDAPWPYIISWKMTFEVMPFGNTLFLMDLTGAQIQELLDQAATLYKGILQSSGITWKWHNDCRCNTPSTWGAFDVEVGGEPLDPSRVYRVVTNNWLAAGGDGWVTFVEGTNRWDTNYDMQEAVNDYIALNSPISPTIEERIVYMESAAPTVSLTPRSGTIGTPETMSTSATDGVIIHKVQVTNVRDTTFNVSWTTNQLATGEVHYGTDPANLDQTAHDGRGAGTSDDIRYVTLLGLMPNTTYYFDVISDGTVDDNNGHHYSVTTGPTLGVPSSDTIYGQVFESNGIPPAEGVIVYITLRDADGAGSSGEAGVMSALVDAGGWWHANLGNARLAGSYFTYSAVGDAVVLMARDADGGFVSRTVDTGDLGLVAPLTLLRQRQPYLPLVVKE